jgi:MFS family permease
MLIFTVAVLVIAPKFGLTYGELLPYATPGFIAFGAGALVSGWLGDKWSRRNMMAIFFVGMGLTLSSMTFVQTPLQLGAVLLCVGIMASIYHPVGTSMLGKYTADEWRGRAYSIRYFLGFTAAGLSVGLVSILYNEGGFELMLKSVAALSLLTVLGAVIFPREKAPINRLPI